MKLNNISDYYSSILFYIYVPVTFIIWLLVVTNRTVLVGAYSLSIIAILGYLLVSINKIKLDKNYLLVALFLIYCFTLTSIHYMYMDAKDILGRSLALFHYNLYLMYLSAYLYGRYVNFKVNIISYTFFIIILILISTIVDFSKFSLDFSLINPDSIAIYLALANLFTIYLIFLITNTSKNWLRLLLFTLGCMFLFLLNSRSSLYAFVIVMLIYQGLFLKSGSRTLNVLMISIAVLILLSTSYFDTLIENNSRMLAIFNDIGADDSVNERKLLFEVGLERTLNKPIMGDYGGVIKEFNNLGSYIHNILSYWQAYGLIPFMLVVYFFLIQAAYISYKSFKDRFVIKSDIYFNISIYTILLLVISQSYAWHYAWFFLGFLHTYKSIKISK